MTRVVAGTIPHRIDLYMEERCDVRGCAGALLFKVRVYRESGGGLEVQIKCDRCRTLTARRYSLPALMKLLATARS